MTKHFYLALVVLLLFVVFLFVSAITRPFIDTHHAVLGKFIVPAGTFGK